MKVRNEGPDEEDSMLRNEEGQHAEQSVIQCVRLS